MSARSFILVGFFTLLLLTLSLHGSLVRYVEQQYHNFSESKSPIVKALAFAWEKSFLQDNALFAFSEGFLESLEEMRSGIVNFLAQSATPPKNDKSKKKKQDNKQTKKPQKPSPAKAVEPPKSVPPTAQGESQKGDKEAQTLNLHDRLANPESRTDSASPTPLPTSSSPTTPLPEPFLSSPATSQGGQAPLDSKNSESDPAQSTQAVTEPQSLQPPKAQSQAKPQAQSPKPKPKKAVKNPRIRLESGDSVLLIGDSMMQGSAPYMLKAFKKLNLNGINLSKHSTGLTYKHYFDWANATQEAFEKDPNITLVVVLLGANDPWGMKKQGGNLAFKSPAWEEVYRQRIDEIIEIAHSYGAHVAWYEVPYVRDEALNKKIIYLNTLYEAQVRQSGEFYFKSNGILTQGGRYDAFIKDYKGNSVQVRIDDGVHFTARGYWLLANILLSALEVNKDEGAE